MSPGRLRFSRNDLLGVMAAYTMLIVAVVACALAFAVYGALRVPRLPRITSGYRDYAVGYLQPTGPNYSTVGSWTIDNLPPLLPAGYSAGAAYLGPLTVTLRIGGPPQSVKAVPVMGAFMQAAHLHPLAGRLLTLQDVYHGRAVAVLTATLAQRWFGGIAAAVGQDVFSADGSAQRVVGVIADPNNPAWTNDPLQVWVPYDSPLTWPRNPEHKSGNADSRVDLHAPSSGMTLLLSTPRNVGTTQLQTVLRNLLQRDHRRLGVPQVVHRLIFTRAYSLDPLQQKAAQQRALLFVGLAVSALVLALVNMLCALWLQYLRQRPVLRLERILGARRGYWGRRTMRRALLFYVLAFAVALPLFALMLTLLRTQMKSISLHPYLHLHLLWPRFVTGLALVLLVVVLLQSLPVLVLLLRDRTDALTQRVVGGLRDRQVGAALQVLQVLLAALLSVVATWSIQHAWRIAHAPLGFLDCPATIVQIASHGSNPQHASNSNRNELLMAQMLEAVHQVLSQTAAGFGPAIGSKNWELRFPTTVRFHERAMDACHMSLTPGWVQATDMHLLAGTTFAAQPNADVALVSADLATHLFGGPAEAVGRTLHDRQFLPGFHAVVQGVVAPVSVAGATHPACPTVFSDKRAQSDNLLLTDSTLAIATATTATQRNELRAALARVLQRQGVAKYIRIGRIQSAQTMRIGLAAPVVQQARLLLVLAVVAWMIALGGVAVLLRLSLAHRRHLLALRSALGERPSVLYSNTLLETLAYAAAGIAVLMLGLPWLAEQYRLVTATTAQAFGPSTWLALAVLLLAVFLVAHFPARRAARAEPAESLHEL